MARTIAEIKQSIVDAKNADANLSQLTSNSAVADWNLWAYIVAVCQWTIEKLFDKHVDEVQQIISAQKPHTLQWYVTKAKAFQYGIALPEGSDTYDNSGYTADEIATMQIVNFASATEIGTGLRIKVATLSGNSLAPIPATPELEAITGYMNLVKDAGVRLTITSDEPDRFATTLRIYYNPLVLNAMGQRLDGMNNNPVQDAITGYLDSLPFNGIFILNEYIAALQAVDGVIIAEVDEAKATYGSLPFTVIAAQYRPDAGYLAIDLNTDLTINFYPYASI